MTTRLPLKGGDILLLIIAGIAALATIGAAVLFLRDGANGVVVHENRHRSFLFERR